MTFAVPGSNARLEHKKDLVARSPDIRSDSKVSSERRHRHCIVVLRKSMVSECFKTLRSKVCSFPPLSDNTGVSSSSLLFIPNVCIRNKGVVTWLPCDVDTAWSEVPTGKLSDFQCLRLLFIYCQGLRPG